MGLVKEKLKELSKDSKLYKTQYKHIYGGNKITNYSSAWRTFPELLIVKMNRQEMYKNCAKENME